MKNLLGNKVGDTVFTYSTAIPICATWQALASSHIVRRPLEGLRRELVIANAEQIAVLNQTYTVQFNELVKSTRLSLVVEMTDQEIIATTIQ